MTRVTANTEERGANDAPVLVHPMPDDVAVPRIDGVESDQPEDTHEGEERPSRAMSMSTSMRPARKVRRV